MVTRGRDGRVCDAVSDRSPLGEIQQMDIVERKDVEGEGRERIEERIGVYKSMIIDIDRKRYIC